MEEKGGGMELCKSDVAWPATHEYGIMATSSTCINIVVTRTEKAKKVEAPSVWFLMHTIGIRKGIRVFIFTLVRTQRLYKSDVTERRKASVGWGFLCCGW